MRRRQFLRNATAIGLPIALNGVPVAALPSFGEIDALSVENDRILVLVQLIGGNDGLNTIIPINRYQQLNDYRKDILIPENQVLKINENTGFHPAMEGIKSIYDDGQLGVIQDVGYPNQNRSHFRSTDIWSTASASEEVLSTGWLGRYFQEEAPTFPDAYPNEDNPDPFAIAVGNTVSATCQGEIANFGLAVNDPFSLTPIQVGEAGTLPDNYYGTQLKFMRNAITQTNEYGEVMKIAAEKGQSLSKLYPDGNRLGEQMQTVVKLISGGLQTKVYVVRLGGFDTHSDQVQSGDVTKGRHGTLLETLSGAIAGFQDDLNLLGLEKRVVGMTFSEFGRRIRSNGSLGTDHGTAAPLMVFGNCVQSGIMGNNPELPEDASVGDGVSMQYDFRDVYGSMLQDWFGLEEERIQSLLFPDYTYLPILSNCSLAVSTSSYFLRNSLRIFPQPARSQLNIAFQVDQFKDGRLSVLDIYGRTLKVQSLQNLAKGAVQIRLNINRLPKGQYLLRIELGDSSVTKQFIKL